MSTPLPKSMEARIAGLLQKMTLEEKVSLTAGDSMWTTPPVERLGIPRMKMTDGPNGARGQSLRGDVTSACFPVGVALAATWNTDLIHRIGEALAEETTSKGAHILLGPTVNIHRSPLAGRNFETYSEDPFLASRIAVAYIKGLQSRNVGATIKHFVCNDSEFERMTISSEVRERTLREIYLPPFRAAVQEAGTWVAMTAYNRLNGVYCSENAFLVNRILKEEWGFDGFVVSDWFGTHSTVDAANNGVDLEMPGPAVWLGSKLLKAVQSGSVSEGVVDDKVRRLLRTMARTGALDSAGLLPEQAVDKPEHRALLRATAAEAIVLLKNRNHLLPLNPEKVKRLAVIGPNAKVAKIQGGGSAAVTPHYAVSPYDGILARAGDEIEVAYHLGCASYKQMPLVDPDWVTPGPQSAEQGWSVAYFDNPDLLGEPVTTKISQRSELVWGDGDVVGMTQESFSLRMQGSFTPSDTGFYTFGLVTTGPSRLYVNGRKIVDNWTDWAGGGEGFYGMGNLEATGEIELRAGQMCEIRIEYSKQEMGLAGIRLGVLPPLPADALDQAAALAASSDVPVVCVGLGNEWESEGFDRPDMDLPSEQVELIEAVSAANPNTVVVLNTGSPITMPWLDRVGAIVQAWYPGQESGNALADVLFGDVNPSGRLPVTFPHRLQDNPAYINYPGENGQVHYGEGIFVGYRYYDEKGIDPLFPFGYGLSYTTFAYDNLALDAVAYDAPDKIRVSVDVTNTGRHPGQEVVQLYVRDPVSSLARPEKELKGFRKIHLEPGATQTVDFELSHHALAYYDPARKGWLAEAGEFHVLVGSSSRDIRLQGSFSLKEQALVRTASGPEETVQLSIESTVAQLLASDEARALLEKHFPGLTDTPRLGMAMGYSMKQLASFAPDIFTDEALSALNEDLLQLSPVAAAQVPQAPELNWWRRLLTRVISWYAQRRSR